MGAKVLWSLYNKSDKQQIDHLKTEQVQALISIVPEEQRKTWYVWKAGTTEWKPVTIYPELVVAAKLSEDLPPPPPPHAEPGSEPVISEESLADRTAQLEHEPVDLALDKAQVQKRRSSTEAFSDSQVKAALIEGEVGTHLPTALLESQGAQKIHDSRSATRFKKKFKLRADIGDSSYSAETLDISLTGMRLRQPLPVWVRGRFFVQMFNGKERLVIECSVYMKNGKPDLSRLIIEHADQMDVLRDWLLSAI